MRHDANPSLAVLPDQVQFSRLIGTSSKMQELYDLIRKVSQHTCPVLIVGESGTGKELIAHRIHDLGPRRMKFLVPVDCSALAPTLIESELFGHVIGAFTGADHAARGLFEAANEGTLFLDEIGELPFSLQAKLLRVLQEKEIRRIGSTERIPINVRVIAATNRDLEEAVRKGTFRQDLYYRLNVVEIKLPALRERRGDIPLLVNHFLRKFCDPQEPLRTLSDDAMRLLMSSDWPGNVRELENAIECAVAMSPGPVLSMDSFPANVLISSTRCPLVGDDLLPLEEITRRAIFRALRETDGHRPAAARMLGIGKTTLYRKLKEFESEQLLSEP
jgi:transcriptional regulator with PAS, ATPase and Fis domain